MNHTDHEYDFERSQYLDPSDYTNKTREQLDHLVLVDRCMHRASLRDVEFEFLMVSTDDSLRALLAPPRAPAAPPPAAPKPERVSKPRPTARARFKAQLWHEGKNISLGYFDTEAQRDDAIESARIEYGRNGALELAQRVNRRALAAAPRYKAQLWYLGKNEALGWFLNEQVRNEAVTMAKVMRDLGFPLDAIRAQVERMK